VGHVQFTSSFPFLQELSLREYMAKRAVCAWLSRLRTVSLHEARIGDAGLTTLLAAPYLNGLRTLDLYCNELTDASMDTLLAAKVPECSTLSLDLNRIADAGAVQLAKHLDWPSFSFSACVSTTCAGVARWHW
jgi:hypothetical protein